MAFIEKIEWRSAKEGARRHDPISCEVFTFEDNEGRRVLQIDSAGSKERKNPGKLSQTLQFDSDSARELVATLIRAFPELKP